MTHIELHETLIGSCPNSNKLAVYIPDISYPHTDIIKIFEACNPAPV